MGCDLRFYLISASSYFKVLRPKLIECYGGINVQRAEITERERLKSANFIKNLWKARSLKDSLMMPTEVSDGPVEKYLNSGGSQNEDLQYEIYQLFKTKAQRIYYQRNHFLRSDRYLQQIDSFQRFGYYMKVSNTYQLQNYCRYLQGIKQVLEHDPKCEWANQYYDIGEAEEMFNNCYKQMKQSEEEKLLIFQSSG